MALSAIALVSMDEARAVLGLSGDHAHDAEVEAIVNQASALAENTYIKRPLRQRTVTDLRVDGPCTIARLYPDLWPIDTGASLTVTVDGTAQTVWKSEGDGDPEAADVQAYPDHFYRAGGWAPTGRTQRNVRLTYTGGYEPVPDDLKEGVLELVLKLWGPLTQQRPDFASIAGPGGSLQTLEGQWSGQSGPNTPWSLSRRTKEVFQSYRVIEAT